MALRVGIAGAVEALARGLAIDLAPIRVNTVSVGAVDTEVSIDHSCPMTNKYIIP